MASTSSPPSPVSLFLGSRNGCPLTKQVSILIHQKIQNTVARRKNQHAKLCVFAAKQEAEKPQRPPPGVDTRIHWESEDEGWIGGSNSNVKEEQLKAEADEKNLLGETFTELLNSTDSHYQFLGVPPNADLEEIKSAYRRLSKEYHPDTTSLPLKTASEKFMRLRDIYDVLSDEETRRFYDWTLAQEAASRQAEKMRIKLEDPYEQDLMNYEPVPDLVDRLGGRNIELSDQAMTALTFDAIILVFSICCIVYAVFFKEY